MKGIKLFGLAGLILIFLAAGCKKETATRLTPKVNDTAYFRYIGRFIDGVAFDSVSTVKAPYKYVIGSGLIVSGVDEGLQYMKEGGKAGLLTPSKLAWEAKGVYGVIPSYAPLLWEIELVSVKAGLHKK